MPNYPHLFSPIRVGSQIMKNRIIMPGMATSLCTPDGFATQEMCSYYAKRARGGVGTIIMEFTSVAYPQGLGANVQFQLADERVVTGLATIADAVHAYGTKLLIQLHHAGARSVARPGVETIGPMDEGDKVRMMTEQDIKDLTAKFVKAAKNAQQAGLDGVEIHAGHGYLISQFLSPITNQRTDAYGGTLEGRCRMLVEIIEAIREACGKAFVISVRLAVRDWDPRGTKVEEGVEFAKMCEAAGADLINITTGIKYKHWGGSETQERPDGNRLYLAEAVKPHVNIPVSVVGKLRTGEMCDGAIESGITDMVTVGRQLIADPNWPNKLREGRDADVRRCLNCSEGCYGSLARKGAMRCAISPYVGYESVYDEDNLPKANEIHKVVIVGGGIAGMQAAVTAAERGHNVVLLEKANRLGGQLNLACVPPDKGIMATTIDYFERRMQQVGVDVLLGVEATPEKIQELEPDTVILATGSLPSVAPIPGIEKAVESWDVLSGKVEMPMGKNIVIIGGGTVGMETGLLMLEHDNKITILEMLPNISNGQEGTHRTRDLNILKEAEANIQTLAKVQKVNDDSVEYIDKDGNACVASADMIVVSTGQRPAGQELYDALVEMDLHPVFAGDAIRMGNLRHNVRSGFLLGYDA